MLKNIIIIIILIIELTSVSYASDTSLLFVGEDISMLTIASRRAESPENAPAIAGVITSAKIEKKGYKTLAEILSDLPGFYISPDQSGSVPYLRGLPNSVLFLYDSVHFTSDAAKSVPPLDQELSLAHVERIEIIRGPGSVLWGPDAFAGIVNIVPKRGRDIDGLVLSTFGGSANEEGGGSVSWGKNAGLWEAFISLSATSLEAREPGYNVVKLTGPDGRPAPPSERMGSASVNRSNYTEAVFNFSWKDWLRLSGRWSDTKKEYVLEDSGADLSWPATLDKPIWYMRLELEKKFTSSALRLNGYYNELDKKNQELDFPLQDRNSHVSYGELLYDKELWGANGMLTLGISYRHNRISGAEITKAYLPDFFKPGNIAFLPLPRQTNFSTYMSAVFGQLKHRWDHFDAWCGLRVADHNEYDIEISPNIGMIWSPSSRWNLKMLYGTSYRTPYAGQLVGRNDLAPEKIQNISAGLTWRPTPAIRFTATAFRDQIENQTTQDPYYGGLSDPATQNIHGLEFEADWQISPKLRLRTNATTFTHNGDDETYTYYAYTLENFIWTLKPWISWDIPCETGPQTMINAGFTWTPAEKITLSLNAEYETSWDYFYAKGSEQETVSSNLQINTAIIFRDIRPGLDLQLSIKNLTNNTNKTKGTYGPTDPPPFNGYLELKWEL